MGRTTATAGKAHERPGAPRPKPVLFCPDCGLETSVATATHATGEDGTHLVRCPSCGYRLLGSVSTP